MISIWLLPNVCYLNHYTQQYREEKNWNRTKNASIPWETRIRFALCYQINLVHFRENQDTQRHREWESENRIGCVETLAIITVCWCDTVMYTMVYKSEVKFGIKNDCFWGATFTIKGERCHNEQDTFNTIRRREWKQYTRHKHTTKSINREYRFRIHTHAHHFTNQHRLICWTQTFSYYANKNASDNENGTRKKRAMLRCKRRRIGWRKKN